MSQAFGTREEPREIHGILGPGGGGKAARTVMGNGTRELPREVKDGAVTNKGQGARVVGAQSIRRMGAVRQPAPAQAQPAIQRSIAVRKVESHGVRAGSQGVVTSHALSPHALAAPSGAASRETEGGGVDSTEREAAPTGAAIATRRHLREGLTLVHPGEGERAVVIGKGAAGALQRFFQSHATVNRTFWASIMRSVSDAMMKPLGEAGPSGLMEIAVVIRQEDIRALQMACRRVQPSKEARERLKKAFAKAFSRERETENAEIISADPSFASQLDQDFRVNDHPDQATG